MKKLIASVGTAAAIAVASMPAFAAFKSLPPIRKVVAQTTTAGTPTVNVNVTVVDPDFGSPTSAPVTWAGVDPGTVKRGWKIADSVIKVDYTLTAANGGIQIYTDNVNAPGTSTDPIFQDPTASVTSNLDSNPAGLLLVTGSTFTAVTLPLAWSIKSDLVQILAPSDVPLITTANQIAPAEPNDNGLVNPTVDKNAFQWLYMLDKGTPAIDRNGNGTLGESVDTGKFTNADPYVKIASISGIHFGQGPSDFAPDGDHHSYVYLEANFATAAAAATYKSSQITFEAFTE